MKTRLKIIEYNYYVDLGKICYTHGLLKSFYFFAVDEKLNLGKNQSVLVKSYIYIYLYIDIQTREKRIKRRRATIILHLRVLSALLNTSRYTL